MIGSNVAGQGRHSGHYTIMFHYHAGLFWDGVEIQTRGQKSDSISCLSKYSDLKDKEILERMKE